MKTRHNNTGSVNTSDVYVRPTHAKDGRRNKAGLRRQQIPAQSIARFHAKYQKTPSCWLWLAGKYAKGYGMFNVARTDGRQHTEYAHRVAYVLAHGDIPQGFVVMHSCDVRACCNPAHLVLGTQGENVRDGVAKGRYSVPHLGARSLTDADVRLVRASGERGVVLAKRFNVTPPHISMIRRGLRRTA